LTPNRYAALALLVVVHLLGCAHAQHQFAVQFSKGPTATYETRSCSSQSGLTLLPRHDIDAHRREASELAARPDPFVTTPAEDPVAGGVWLPINRVEGGLALVSHWTAVAKSNALFENDLDKPCAGSSCWKVLLAQESCTSVVAKCALTRIEGVQGPPECEPIAILDDPPLIRARPPPFVAIHGDHPRLGPQEELTQADVFLSRMNQASSLVHGYLDQARQARDVVQSLCESDKASQLDVALRSARDREAALRGAAKNGDDELADHEFTVLTVLAQRAEQLSAESNQCIGEETAFVGDTQIVAPSSVSVTCDRLMPLLEKQLRDAANLRLTTWFLNKYQVLKAVAERRFSTLLATPDRRLWEEARVTVLCIDRSEPATIDIEAFLLVSNTNSADDKDWYEAPPVLQAQYVGELSSHIEAVAHTLCGSSSDDLLVEKTSKTDGTYRCR
jgi:hypothetical protein